MQDWYTILHVRLPAIAPTFKDQRLCAEDVTSELVALVDWVWVRAEYNCPDTDRIMEEVITSLLAIKDVNPRGYRWARLLLMSRFRALSIAC